jgi:putative transposase
MARLPRLTLAGQAHALLQRGLGTRAVFVDDTDRQYYLLALREAASAESCAVHAFALHEHEVRLLATPATATGLGRLMQAVGRRYVSAYHRRHGGAGTLWAGRFRSAVVEPGPLLLDAMLWTETPANTHPRVESPGAPRTAHDREPETQALAYPQLSSAGHHSGGVRTNWLTDPPEYWALGNTPFEREDRWRQLLLNGLPAARAQRMQAAVWGGWPLCGAVFASDLANETCRPARPRARGRPRQR